MVELDRRAFSLARLESVRSIGDAMKCDGVEQLLVEGGPERGVAASLKVDQRLKRFQRLQRPFEADRSRLHSAFRRRLRHDRADEIVGEDVRPDFFVDEFRRLAAQDVHLHRGLDRPQIELVVPAGTIQTGQVLLGRFHWVQQGRHHDNGLRSESRLLDAKASFANRHVLRQRVVGSPIHRANRRRLMPADDVIVVAQARSAAKVGFPVGFVESTHQVDAALLKQHDPRPIGQQAIGQQHVAAAKDVPQSAE